ncbi:MAG: hypothetical protein HOP31_08450 [Ignavibacteria bacterium]|nr:hypothetical protein [Ignavibacteria bacterium]
MMTKIFLLTALSFVLLFISNTRISAQDDMDFEEFMGMMSETMTDEQLDQLSFNLPWNIKVVGYGYGDFSGDGKEDIVLSIIEKDKTPKKSVDVYFFENVENTTFKKIKKKNYKWYEVTLEIAFLMKDGKCFVTSRDDNSWYFAGYEIINEKLVAKDVEKYPIEFENAGN